MFSNRSCFIVPVILSLAFTLVGRARAGLIYTQAGVQGSSSDGSGDGSSDHYQSYVTNFVSGGEVSSATGSAFETRSSASVGLVGTDAGIHLFSSSHTSNFPGYSPGSQALAAGQWEDVIRLAGNSLPNSILIHVSVAGNLNFSAPPTNTQYQEYVRVGIANTAVVIPPGTAPTDAANVGPGSEALIQRADPSEGGNILGTSNTNGFFYSATSGNIGWEATFLVSYDSSYGGYHFNLYASDSTRAIAFTDVTADFSHTFRLTAVTQADGSALTGPISFDSGFQLQSVPEPSSLVMLGTGAVGVGVLGGLCRGRRGRVA
jgi:hypothetical protein